ncbi:MAG TPA: hypothetical protein VK705_07380, partial [Ferruginibacter sp.]|nr:hypothetical protein [Ferruginibacter sp.]
TGNGNTAIGTLADVGSSGLRNATAIGSKAKVSASNCLVLGGTGSNSVYVGIGVASPIADLEVADGGGPNSNCHIKSLGTTPTTYTVTTTNGITGMGFVSGSTDTKGTITTTGTQNGVANTELTITFDKPYNVAPVVVITPANGGMGVDNNGISVPQLAEGCSYYVTSTPTTFSLFFYYNYGNTGCTAPSFNYHIIE